MEDNKLCLEKQPLNQEMLDKIDAYWRAANYLSAGQLYLLDNPLLREPLTMDQIKKKIVGHWGTVRIIKLPAIVVDITNLQHSSWEIRNDAEEIVLSELAYI